MFCTHYSNNCFRVKIRYLFVFRVQQALGADDVSMLKHLLVEIPDLVDNYLHRPLAHLAAEHGNLSPFQYVLILSDYC